MAEERPVPEIGGAALSIGRTLEIVHDELREVLPGISRLAFALYDPDTDRLKTFVHSTLGENPLPRYEAVLAEVPSLAALARERRTRVVADLPAGSDQPSFHAGRIVEAGYRSSFTKPVFDGDTLFGFIFMDSRIPGYFTPPVVEHLQVFIQLVTLALIVAVSPVKVLVSAVELAEGLSRYRDQETGAHMRRMSRYARLIAKGVAAERGLSDEDVEFLFMFAPLHDVGKIAIPDAVLLKRGRLDPAELAVMRSHVLKGVAVVDRMIKAFGLAGRPHVETLRNIVLCHHEAFDGSGYPAGLVGEDIPVEGRIVAVADIYDALTSKRPYKEAWDSGRAFGFLAGQAGKALDPACVAALVAARAEVEEIAARFREDGEEGTHEGYFDWV